MIRFGVLNTVGALGDVDRSTDSVADRVRIANELLLKQGDGDRTMYFLERGNLQVYVTRTAGSQAPQQKIAIGRLLHHDAGVLLLDEPTRGIDVGAHAEIVRTINRLREDGMAMLVISSELEELVAYSSRVRVLRDHQHVNELSGEAMTTEGIVAAIASCATTPPPFGS